MSDTDRETLTDIFAGYINQQTLEDGAVAMVIVSQDEPDWHQRFEDAITHGAELARRGDSTVIEIINRSGYGVRTAEEAEAMLQELHRLYTAELSHSSARRAGTA